MQKGLQLLFGEIKKRPDNHTLVTRYLSLLADLPSDKDKADKALELAEAIKKEVPLEAMNIAHMVFKFDHSSIAALNLIGDCLDAMGRKAKAAVIRNEVSKLNRLAEERRTESEEEKEAEGPPKLLPIDYLRPPAPPAAPRPNIPPPSPPLPDINFLSSQAATVADNREAALDLLFATDRPMSTQVTEGPGPSVYRSQEKTFLTSRTEQEIKRLSFESKDRDDQSRTEAPSPAQLDLFGPQKTTATQENQGPVISLNIDESHASPNDDVTIVKSREDPVPQRQEEKEAGDLFAAVSLFDYYWRQGLTKEARDLITQTEKLARDQRWWQSRFELVKDLRLDDTKARPSMAQQTIEETKLHVFDPLMSSDTSSSAPSHIAAALADDIQHVARIDGLDDRLKGWTSLSQASDDPFPETFWTELRQKVTQLGEANLMQTVEDLLQSLFALTPHPDVHKFLEQVGLDQASEALWGLYLDSLVASGAYRSALQTIRTTIERHPRLSWAQTAIQRIPVICEALGMPTVAWQPEEGIAALKTKLCQRPKLTIKDVAAY